MEKKTDLHENKYLQICMVTDFESQDKFQEL